jgi:hypothetical protein
MLRQAFLLQCTYKSYDIQYKTIAILPMDRMANTLINNKFRIRKPLTQLSLAVPIANPVPAHNSFLGLVEV